MKCFQLDDWLMLVSQVGRSRAGRSFREGVKAEEKVGSELTFPQAIYSMSCAFVVAGVKHGMGRHNLAITNEDDKTTALMVRS